MAEHRRHKRLELGLEHGGRQVQQGGVAPHSQHLKAEDQVEWAVKKKPVAAVGSAREAGPAGQHDPAQPAPAWVGQ